MYRSQTNNFDCYAYIKTYQKFISFHWLIMLLPQPLGEVRNDAQGVPEISPLEDSKNAVKSAVPRWLSAPGDSESNRGQRLDQGLATLHFLLNHGF